MQHRIQNTRMESSLPEELALKIYAEYFPAPPDNSSDCYFRISINQQVDGKIWIYMVTFVTLENRVIPTFSRTYPRALEHTLSNIGLSIDTTLLNDSDIEFRPSSTNCHGTAGLIGPLTEKQNRCNCCHERRFSSYSTTSKSRVSLLQQRPNGDTYGDTNLDYVYGLIQRALDQVRTRNQILVHAVLDSENMNRRTMWIRLQKPLFPLWKILSKTYNNKKNNVS